MRFAYYMSDDGTEEGKRKDIEDMCCLMGLGYVGFTGMPGNVITMYQSFRLGIPQAEPRGREDYRLHVRGGFQEC